MCVEHEMKLKRTALAGIKCLASDFCQEYCPPVFSLMTFRTRDLSVGSLRLGSKGQQRPSYTSICLTGLFVTAVDSTANLQLEIFFRRYDRVLITVA